MSAPSLTWEPLYDGADIERLLLGRIAVGQVIARGKRTEWISFLPNTSGLAAVSWRPARSYLAAKNALVADTRDWLRLAGLVTEAEA